MEKISSHQLFYIGTISTINAALFSLPAQTVRYANQMVWISYLLAFAVVMASIWLISKATNRFPDQDLFGAMILRFPFVGRVFALVYVVFFFIILIRDTRMLTDFFNISLLPQTPLWVITALAIITITLMARSGVEILGRMTEFFAPALFIVFLALPFMFLKEIDYTFLLPLFEFDWKGIGIGTWYAIPYMGEIIVMALIYSNKTFRFRLGLQSLLFGTILLMILTICSLLILGASIIPRLLYPTYELVRQLRITDFLDRFELPLIAIWLPSMLNKMAYSLFVVSHGFQRIMPSVPARFITTPFGVLAFVCSFWFFRDAIQLFQFNRTWTLIALIPELIIPLFLYLILRPKAINNQLQPLEK